MAALAHWALVQQEAVRKKAANSDLADARARLVRQRAVRCNNRRRDAGRSRATWFREQVERAGQREVEEPCNVPGWSNGRSSSGARAGEPDRTGNERHNAHIPGRCLNRKTGSRG
jgi:hypothetical protein